MIEVAFVTYLDSPEIVEDDLLVAEILRRDGVSVVAAPWDDPSIDWTKFACVVIRSPWNYYLQPDRYTAWLQSCGANRVRLWNPPRTVLGNIHKSYLSHFADQGVDVVPGEFIAPGDHQSLRQILSKRGWKEAVVKPAISAGAHQTWRTSLASSEMDQTRFAAQCGNDETIVQPYLEAIAAQGEMSLLFFAGAYSHSVIKRPAQGDFRVQHQHGGNYESISPSPALIEQAQKIMATADSSLLYARVDGVIHEGTFLLMELEINEPFLFLGSSPQAAQRFARAIQQKL